MIKACFHNKVSSWFCRKVSEKSLTSSKILTIRIIILREKLKKVSEREPVPKKWMEEEDLTKRMRPRVIGGETGQMMTLAPR